MSQTASAPPVVTADRPARVSDYVLLLKPRVMSLVVFTGAAGIAASPDAIHPILGFALLLSIALGAGGAGALNMWYDADIDRVMRRTQARPVPSGVVSGDDALMLGLLTSVLAVLLAALAGGPLAAGLLGFSIWFYAVVYTQWLKRRTAQNIVIGGLAGALPPAIGWAGTSGTAPLDAWLLVLLIFLWTPPHFWALALYRSEDYAKAGVPMLPVTAGAKATRAQILLYSAAMLPASLAPVATGLGGWVYAVVASLSGVTFLMLAIRVFRIPGDGSGLIRAERAARNLFAFSILYLFLLFGALLAEHALGLHAPLPGIVG